MTRFLRRRLSSIHAQRQQRPAGPAFYDGTWTLGLTQATDEELDFLECAFRDIQAGVQPSDPTHRVVEVLGYERTIRFVKLSARVRADGENLSQASVPPSP